MKRAERDAVEREVRRLVDVSPFEIFELRIGEDRSIHLYLDRKDGALSVDEAARFNHFLRRELFGLGVDVDAWSIVVESPGAFRPLRDPRQFEKNRGKRVRVVRRNPEARPQVLTGILRHVEAALVRVEPEGGGAAVEVPFSDIANARLDPKLPF